MIEFIDIGVEGALAYRISGKITRSEIRSIFTILRKKIENREDLVIYQEVEGFGGAEAGAFIEKLKFLKEFGLSGFKRIAVVSPVRFIHRLADIEGRLFKRIQMRGFSTDRRRESIEYLRSPAQEAGFPDL